MDLVPDLSSPRHSHGTYGSPCRPKWQGSWYVTVIGSPDLVNLISPTSISFSRYSTIREPPLTSSPNLCVQPFESMVAIGTGSNNQSQRRTFLLLLYSPLARCSNSFSKPICVCAACRSRYPHGPICPHPRPAPCSRRNHAARLFGECLRHSCICSRERTAPPLFHRIVRPSPSARMAQLQAVCSFFRPASIVCSFCQAFAITLCPAPASVFPFSDGVGFQSQVVVPAVPGCSGKSCSLRRMHRMLVQLCTTSVIFSE